MKTVSHTDSHAQLMPKIRAIIASVIGQDQTIGLDTRMGDVAAWDSHATVQIIFATEDHFGFEMTSDDMESLDGVQSLVAVIESHLRTEKVGR